MRTILLFRHAPADYMDGKSCCLGSRTDAPITQAGCLAAARLAPALRAAAVDSVWCSPMLRCRQTAEAMAGGLPMGCVPGLEELDCGAWDGLSFDEIRARYPEDYARRGVDPALPPPGGEMPEMAAKRGLDALLALIARTEGKLAVVAHAGLNRAMLCALLGLSMREMRSLPQPYLCANVLQWDGRRLSVAAVASDLSRRVGSPRPTKEDVE